MDTVKRMIRELINKTIVDKLSAPFMKDVNERSRFLDFFATAISKTLNFGLRHSNWTSNSDKYSNSTEISNGRKIVRMAPIWTKIGRNRSQRKKTFIWTSFLRHSASKKMVSKFCFARVAVLTIVEFQLAVRSWMNSQANPWPEKSWVLTHERWKKRSARWTWSLLGTYVGMPAFDRVNR